MKITNGKIIILTGIIHSVTSLTPLAYGKLFMSYTGNLFFKISDGALEFPILGGQINYETQSAIWFFYFGLLLISLGVLVDSIEKRQIKIPAQFIWAYLIVVLAGAYMIPLSGMTFFMLPHAIYMLIKSKKEKMNIL